MPKKKSIAILEARYYHNDNPTIDGHAKMIIKFCELLKNDYNINLITTFKPLYKEVKNIDGVDSVLVKFSEVKDFKDVILESDIMLLTKPDYMFFHPNTYVWIQANYASIEFNMDSLKNWSVNYFNHPYVKKIIFVSNVIEDSFLSKDLVPREKSMVIPNWIESIEKRPKEYKNDGNFKVAWVSRLLKEKGWRDLVEALKDTDIKADFLGDGDDLPEAIELKKSLNLSNINFLGFVKNPINYLRENASIFVFTSKADYEAMPLSLLEAMSVGIPCVSSNISQTRYILGDGGIFYNNIEELRDIIFRLKNDKSFYEEQAKYSLERAKLFHKDNIKKIWKSLFDAKVKSSENNKKKDTIYKNIKTAVIFGVNKGGALTHQHLREKGVSVLAFVDDFYGDFLGKPIIKLDNLINYQVDGYFIGLSDNIQNIIGYFIGLSDNIQNIIDNVNILVRYIPSDKIFLSIGLGYHKFGKDFPFFSPPEDIKSYMYMFEENSFKKDLMKYFDKIKQKNIEFISLKDFLKLQNFLLKYVPKNKDEIYRYEEIDFDVEEGDIVLDCGASSSKGELNSIYFAKKAGKKGRVYAFEPIPRIYNELLEDVKKYKNIIPIKMGLSNEIKKTYFQDLGIGSKISENGDIEVELTTIDNFVKDRCLERVDFIKMDIEGAELDALYGAVNTIKIFKPKMVISIYHKPEHFYEIPKFIKSISSDYKMWLLNNEFQIDMWGGLKLFCKIL